MSLVLLAPLDPVHDIGLKIMARGLTQAGIEIKLLPPDLTNEEIIQQVIETNASTLLLSRTLGYGVAELLANFIDMADAAGIRERTKIGIGGMAIRPQLAAELGFDAGFGPGTMVEEVLCFVVGKEYRQDTSKIAKHKPDITAGYDYAYKNLSIKEKLDQISNAYIAWAQKRTSWGVERANLRDQLWDVSRWRNREGDGDLYKYYPSFCDGAIKDFYEKGTQHAKTRRFNSDEVKALEEYVKKVKADIRLKRLQHTRKKPAVFNQYGTGCPFMDMGHIHASEAWGADGVVHFDPSWGARSEGLLDGFLTQQGDGTVITPANLNRIKNSLQPSTLWQVRAHRGLNTPETVVLAGKIGADMTKINMFYGSLGAGTEPERLFTDGYYAIKFAQKYNLPFDVVTNEELCGVPAYKAFAGMLIVADVGIKLGAKPILQPLFAYSPEAMINEYMEDNYIDFNAAKIYALRSILNAPIWPGAPIGFLTHTEDRVQSAVTTVLHAALATSLGVDAISIASTDEAYSGGPISVPAKTDTLNGVGAAFRFFGQGNVQPTSKAESLARQLVDKIDEVLDEALKYPNLTDAVYAGVFGSPGDGAYPGRVGKDTVYFT